MYSSDRTTLPTRPAINKNIPVPFLNGFYDKRHTPCSDLRTIGEHSNVTVYDATTMKVKRIEAPNGEVIRRF